MQLSKLVKKGHVNSRIQSPNAYEQVQELQEKYPRVDEIKTYTFNANCCLNIAIKTLVYKR